MATDNLTDDATDDRHDAVEALADEFLSAYRGGEQPCLEAFMSAHPELAHEAPDLIKAIVMLENNVPRPMAAGTLERGAVGRDGLRRQIGDYLLVGEIGRGGMGVVYEAVQQSLGRHVALKVLSLPSLLNSAHLERFRREARAAARLQHSHIVPVFDFGAHDGECYYAMQYVPGLSLDLVAQALRQARAAAGARNARGADESASAPDPAVETRAAALSDTQFSTAAGLRQYHRNVARLGLQVAEALAYAHAEGVLHRDIKPSNLLLDVKGNVWITDFGLAKAEGEDELTYTGDFVGTLRYMAPERLEGWSDRGSDVYSLGVTLYELLSLEPFFACKTRAELVRRIAGDAPPALRRLDSSIPVDLETIVLKAIAKEPAARYHRAEELAEDLRRFLGDRPILARRSTLLERFNRWRRNNRAVAALAAATTALLIATIVILAVSNARIRRESAARIAALEERKAARAKQDYAEGQVWLYRGMFGMDGDGEASLDNFDKALKLAPSDPDILWLRGFALGGWERYDEALADMVKARERLGDSKLISRASRDWFVAMAHVGKGDRAAYRAACREALRKIASESNANECGTLLWMCTVTPDAVEEPAKLVEFAEEVLRAGGAELSGDQLCSVGAALYRAGKLPEAHQRLEEAARKLDKAQSNIDPMFAVYARLFLAMTCAEMSLDEQAASAYAEAEQLAKTIRPPCWVSKLEHKLLLEETREVLADVAG
jgi:serine/threonine protein kinase